MYTLNYGPHHPSTHGVLRLKLTMDGERVANCKPITGYLYRGVERLVESKSFISIIPYIDRLDYLAPVISEHAYMLALESLLQIEVPRRALIIRTIFDELTRISCHVLGIGCATYDMGLLSLFLYGFEEREAIMKIFDAVTGHRMHLAYYIPGGVISDITDEHVMQIQLFINQLPEYLDKVERLALDSFIFKYRTKGVGVISQDMAKGFGISGVNLRSSGVNYDIRDIKPYGIYSELDFQSILLEQSDCYNRTYLRYLEIKQSIKLINRCLDLLEPGRYNNGFNLLRNLRLPKHSIVYRSVENSRGEFGIHLLINDNLLHPFRLHFKAPSFSIVNMLRELLVDCELADISIILGSLDFIMGDCDR